MYIYINTDMNRYILKWAFKKVWVSKNKSKFKKSKKVWENAEQIMDHGYTWRVKE